MARQNSRLVISGILLGLILTVWLLNRESQPGVIVSGPIYSDRAATGLNEHVWRFAIHPKYGPTKTVARYQAICDHFATPGRRIELETSLDYADFERKFRAREPDILLPNPWETLEAMKVGYTVIAMAGESADFRGVFLVRRDGTVKTLQDLKGRSFAYPAPTALAACIMPQWFLKEHGFAVMTDMTHRYVGSQDSAIMSVLVGQTDVGVTWPPPWRMFQKEHPVEAVQLTVLAETESLVNNSVMVRSTMPIADRERLRSMLLELDRTKEGRQELEQIETSRFLPAGDADYDVVRRFIARFEAEVRPVESH